MIFLNIYFRIVRLQCSNRNLLRIYAILKRIEQDDEDLIASLDHRSVLRSKIDNELKSLVEDLKAKNGKIVCSLFALCHHGVKFEFNIYDALREYNFKTCFDCELQNVNQYYNTLYALRSHTSFTDILLEQKSSIENYLMKEI